MKKIKILIPVYNDWESLNKLLNEINFVIEKFDHIELAKVIIEDSGYLDYLKKEEESSNKPDSLSRIDNLNEFIESLKEFENIEGFLEHVSLVMENITNTSEETLTLMTMHAAKGLEFDYVFLAGWEEGVFPSQRSIEESGNQGLEEERRLAYVALTRARKKIYITYVNQNRYSFTSHDYNLPSRFINELPEDKVEINDSKYIQDNNFLDNFLETDSFNEEIITPGRRRLLKNSKKNNIDWDFNQDFEYEIDISKDYQFEGCDIWNAFEVSWLNSKGKPVVRIMQFRIDANSLNIIESKSFKLYLNSFNNTKFDNEIGC